MMKCKDCGLVFPEDDAIPQKENGEIDLLCPRCKSWDVVDVTMCNLCDEYLPYDEMQGDVCLDCLYRNGTAENLMQWCDDKGYTETVEINQFLETMFSAAEIDAILRASLKGLEAFKRTKAQAYIKNMAENHDGGSFSQWLVEQKDKKDKENKKK